MSNQNYLLLNDKSVNNISLTDNSPHSPIVWQTTNGENGEPANDDPSLYGGFNLGLHVQDDPQAVHRNRIQILQDIQKNHPHITRLNWLSQVHGDTVVMVENTLPQAVMPADAQITTQKNIALAIMTADCVPIMLATADSSLIGAVHAGWQGLAKGIIGKTVEKMQNLANEEGQRQASQAQSIQAWVGACIGVQAYEVDERVRQQVLDQMQVSEEELATQFFAPVKEKAGHYMANLPAITEYQLKQAGVTHIRQSGLDSYGDIRFYSYRQQTQNRQAFTGRMATVIFRG